MAGTAPIQLGSAATTGFIFQSGSSVTTDEYGIQACDVQALFPQGANVYTFMPPEGSTFAAVFGNSYLPSSFLLDFFEGAPSVQYEDATVAKVRFKFKRIDPLFVNRRTVSVDSILDYQNNILSETLFWTSGLPQNQVFGFPQPVATVKYSTPTAPGIGSGGLSNIYALPGDSRTQGFPDVPTITVPYSFPVSAGSVVSYWNGTAFVSQTVSVQTVFIFNFVFIPNPRGWQLVKLKYDPIANRNFFAVEEEWRNFYTFLSAQFVSHTP